MADYEYRGPSDIDRAIGVLVGIDTTEHNAIAMMQMDDVLIELQEEYDHCLADPSHRPSDDFISRLEQYIDIANDQADAQLTYEI
jgi:hypothetical protein